eukprot:scaffold3464_cov406-Prasinococcus_capsulatus_cf.AAC.5
MPYPEYRNTTGARQFHRLKHTWQAFHGPVHAQNGTRQAKVILHINLSQGPRSSVPRNMTPPVYPEQVAQLAGRATYHK